MDDTKCVAQPELTKFGYLSEEVNKNTNIITSIFQLVSNFEEKLGESNRIQKEDCDKAEAALSIIERNSDQITTNNDDLVEIRTRLTDLIELF